MPGNSESGKKAANTIRNKYGWDFYNIIGGMGGRKSRGGGFAAVTEAQRKEWGRKGGKKSKRLKETY